MVPGQVVEDLGFMVAVHSLPNRLEISLADVQDPILGWVGVRIETKVLSPTRITVVREFGPADFDLEDYGHI